MGIDISGISDYSSFLQNYKVPTIPKVSLEEVREQERVVRRRQFPLRNLPMNLLPFLYRIGRMLLWRTFPSPSTGRMTSDT